MKLLGPLHICLLVLALVNMVPAVEAEDSWGIMAIAVFSAALSLVWFKFRKGNPPPKWTILTGVAAATGFLVYEMFYPHQEQTVHIIDLSHFIIFLCCCKFFDFQTHRDAGLIAMISFLLMVISAFVTASPLFAFAAIIDVTFGLAWLLHFHTQREAFEVDDRQRKQLVVAVRGTSIDESGPSDLSKIGIKRTVFLCSIFIGITSGAIFLVMPRGWRGGIFSRMHGLVPASVTGFDDVVELNNNPISEDETTVMRARFQTNGKTITDESYQPYMRGLTFDRYVDGRWQRTPTVYPLALSDAALDTPLPIIDIRRPLDVERLVRQEIWLESLGGGTLFGLYPPMMFASNDIGRISIDRKDYVLEAPGSARKAAHYVLWSSTVPISQLMNIAPRQPQMPRDGTSKIPRRIEEFARTFVPEGVDIDDPENHWEVAQAIRDYLISDRFEYVLSRGPPTGKTDPVIDFLFESRKGHCEYFASAMTLLCQSLGMHARMVGGFMGGEFNQVGSFYQFRRRDAHAWVEVWLPDSSWTAFDPTPASASESRRKDESLWASLTRFVDFLQFKWSTGIVSFDERNRAALAESLSAWFSSLFEGRDRPKSIGDRITELLWGPEFLAFWQRVMYWIVLLLCIALIVVLIRIAWILSLMVREMLPRGRRISKTFVRQADAKFYDRMILLLENKGHIKPTSATPREFAERLARANDDLVEMPELIEWFYEAQYGGQSLGRQRWDRVKEFLRRLREDASFGAA